MDGLKLNSDEEQPVPTAWRPLLRDVVRAFVGGDFGLGVGVDGVHPVSDEDAALICYYVADYGETLVELPEEAWTTSIAQQVHDNLWDVLVDLWTAESGRSDMVLQGRFDTSKPGLSFGVHLVYVP